MPVIGKFRRTPDGKINGKIRTLIFDLPLTLVPAPPSPRSDAPAYRAYSGKAEVGAAWPPRATSDKPGATPHLTITLDDPTFPRPINAALFERDDGSFALVWSRR